MPFFIILNYFIAVLVICNPVSALPALLNLTQGRSFAEKKIIAKQTAFAVGIILVVVTWLGAPILNFFGIDIPAFQLAGGVVLFTVAFAMLKAQTSRIQQSKEDQREAEQKESIAVVPLAMPIIAGPGAIATVIVSLGNNPGILNQVWMTFAVVLVAVAIWGLLYFAYPIESVLKHTGINIITRIGGLILASLSVQTIIKGIDALLILYGIK